MKIILCLVRVTWSKHTPETPDLGVEMNKKDKTPRKIRRAPAQRQSVANYGPLALILGLVLVALLAFLIGGAVVASSQLTEVAPKATEESVAPEAPAQPATPQMSAKDAHDQHLLALDPTYRSQGWEAWLRAAGIQFDSSKVESRQPVEEVIQGHVTVTSLVIRATGMKVNWPACITTDRPNEVSTSSETRQYQPDLRNPSVLYTNATLNGQGTVYADCSDWGQLDPTK